MKHLIALSVIALAWTALPAPAAAQASPPALPELTQQQSQDLAARMEPYRRETDARVARGEITPDEAARLVEWREWQMARQITGAAAAPRYGDAPPDYYEARPRDYSVAEPAPLYPPYYVPYYRYYPAPYYARPYAYWGPSICAGGFGRNFGGRICF